MDADSHPVQVQPEPPLVGASVVELVRRVRSELEALDAERRSSETPSLLALDTVEIELHFSVIATSGEDTDLRVLPAGDANGVHAAAVQKVRLQFKVDEQARQQGLLGSRAHATTFTGGAEDDFEPLDDLESTISSRSTSSSVRRSTTRRVRAATSITDLCSSPRQVARRRPRTSPATS